MKKLISILVIAVLLFSAVGCSCSSCGGSKNVPTAKGSVSIAYDKAEAKELLTYYQANQGYVVTFVLLDENTDYETLRNTVRVAVVKDPAVIEKLKEAGWSETAQWTEAQKTNNAKYFNLTVLEALGENGATANEDAVKTLASWLGGEAEPLEDLLKNSDFQALLTE